MSSEQRETSADVEIRRGTVGMVGGSRVGVSSIVATPPPVQGAMPGARATAVVVSEVVGVPVESTLVFAERMLLPLADGLHRVGRVAPPGGSDPHGAIEIAAQAVQPLPANAVFAGTDGRLRIGGPGIDQAVDLRVLAFAPDAHAPQSAQVEWLPAAYPRDHTPQEQIKQQSVRVGDHLPLGKAMLSVKAIQGEGADHAAWIEFTLTPAR